MVTKIDGTFVMDRYGLVKEAGTSNNLTTMLSNLYPTGSILEVGITVKQVGSRPLCEAQAKYSTCRSVLNTDGTCPDAEYHKVEDEVEVAA